MNLVRIYGFPRSGSHLAMELLGRNFYPDADLVSPAGEVGHWADRVKVGPVQFGKLAGHHGPPEWGFEPGRAVYIYRDVRAVLASLWRSPHFKHPRWDDEAFSEFIRTPLDWRWSVGFMRPVIWKDPKTPAQHWQQHLDLWWTTSVLKIRYEELVAHPEAYLEMFAYRFKLTPPATWVLPKQLVGHFPSGGTLAGWRDLWSYEDEAWLFSVVPHSHPGIMPMGELLAATARAEGARFNAIEDFAKWRDRKRHERIKGDV